MHELSITQSLLAVVIEHAEKAGARRVTHVNLRIGGLAGIVDESVQFYFDFLSRGTLAEGACLGFTHVPVRFRCRACAHEFEPEGRAWACPSCGEIGGEITAGREMYVESIEVE